MMPESELEGSNSLTMSVSMATDSALQRLLWAGDKESPFVVELLLLLLVCAPLPVELAAAFRVMVATRSVSLAAPLSLASLPFVELSQAASLPDRSEARSQVTMGIGFGGAFRAAEIELAAVVAVVELVGRLFLLQLLLLLLLDVLGTEGIGRVPKLDGDIEKLVTCCDAEEGKRVNDFCLWCWWSEMRQRMWCGVAIRRDVDEKMTVVIKVGVGLTCSLGAIGFLGTFLIPRRARRLAAK